MSPASALTVRRSSVLSAPSGSLFHSYTSASLSRICSRCGKRRAALSRAAMCRSASPSASYTAASPSHVSGSLGSLLSWRLNCARARS
ncbi:MAG: hypothetical protein A2X52_22455 [Candidatus Rokubacteria bacterium GWC2_70_16]|nr:MAG: hypothetical protein A2X52_22455 [Candidatus Rokubacteria bacterium GWC2_70_16]